MDRLGKHLGLIRGSTPTALFLERLGTGLQKAVLGRCLVFRQFESKRLSSITAIRAKVTARSPASCGTLEDGPASLYATTSPHKTAQPEMCVAAEPEDADSK